MTLGAEFQPFPDQLPTVAPVRNINNRTTAPGAQDQTGLDADTRMLPRQTETRRTPNEFQKFLQVATGKLLPIFGESFFSSGRNAELPRDGQTLQGGQGSADFRSTSPANTFTPIQGGPVPSDYAPRKDPRSAVFASPKGVTIHGGITLSHRRVRF